MLLVLAAPSKKDPYYKKYFHGMIEFYISYANAIRQHDNVVVMADKTTMPFLITKIPDENLLLIDEQLDPWIRDVSPVCPGKDIQFQYSGGLKKKEAKMLQKSFNQILEKYSIEFSKVEYCNDGGNFIYNENQDTIITTDKFLELNGMSKSNARDKLKEIFKVKQVSIVPADDEKLGHIDGMCSFITNKTLLLVDYCDDRAFRDSVIRELKTLKDLSIKEIECPFSDKKAQGGFASSYGIYVNCVSTENCIYVPMFNNKSDENALQLIKDTVGDKIVVHIDATRVCHLGGSLRCLSWEVHGKNSEKIMTAARNSIVSQ